MEVLLGLTGSMILYMEVLLGLTVVSGEHVLYMEVLLGLTAVSGEHDLYMEVLLGLTVVSGEHDLYMEVLLWLTAVSEIRLIVTWKAPGDDLDLEIFLRFWRKGLLSGNAPGTQLKQRLPQDKFRPVPTAMALLSGRQTASPPLMTACLLG